MGTIHAGGRCRIMANVSARGYSDNISALYFADVDFMRDGVTFEMVCSDHDRPIFLTCHFFKFFFCLWGFRFFEF